MVGLEQIKLALLKKEALMCHERSCPNPSFWRSLPGGRLAFTDGEGWRLLLLPE